MSAPPATLRDQALRALTQAAWINLGAAGPNVGVVLVNRASWIHWLNAALALSNLACVAWMLRKRKQVKAL